MSASMIRLITGPKNIAAFLAAADCNWRNAVYIECATCPYGNPSGCQDLLFMPDGEGRPLLLPVPDAQLLWGRRLDKTECICTCSRLRFQELFTTWLKQSDVSAEGCRLIQALQRDNLVKEW